MVDEKGQPLEAAQVSCVPDAWVLWQLGYREESGFVPIWHVGIGPLSAGRIDLGGMPRALAGADGRFELAIPFQEEHPRVGTHESPRLFPELIVQRDGSVPARRVCREFAAAGFDVGDIVLPRGATVTGRMVDEQGQAIRDVDVQAAVEGHSLPVGGDVPQFQYFDPGTRLRFACSSSDGRFRFPGLWPGALELHFEGAARLALSRAGIGLGAGDALDLGDILLERGPAISGRVIDEAGRPLPGAEVRISIDGHRISNVKHAIHLELGFARWGHMVGDVYDGGELFGEREGRYCVTQSDDDGRFVIGGLTRPDYLVFAAADGREPDGTESVPTGSDDVVLQLRPQGSLRIRVLDAVTDAPVGDARLTVLRGIGEYFDDHGTSLPVRPDEAARPGAFVVDEVCPARMAAVIDSESHGRQILALDGLALGSPTEERVLRVTLAGRVAGHVHDATGAPLAQARVWLAPYEHEQALGLLDETTATSDEDGRFEFAGVTPAHWSLGVGLDGYGSKGTVDLELAAGESRDDVDLVLARLGHVEGRVVGPDGAPIKDVSVIVTVDETSSTVESYGHTGDDGRFQADVRPGTYIVVLDVVGSARKFRQEIEVASDETVHLDFALPDPAVISGRVLTAGLPTPGCVVTLRGTRLDLRATTDKAGEYRIQLPAGGEGQLRARSTRGGITAPRPFQAVAGQSVVCDLEFGAATIEGTVVDALTGRVIAGAGIAFSSRGGAGYDAPRATTDSEGRFSIRDVAEGRWVLLASQSRYQSSGWIGVEVRPQDNPTQVRLELTPGATLRGIVRTNSGALTRQGLQIQAWFEGSRDSSTQDASTTDGAYELLNLRPGHYTLLAVLASPAAFLRQWDYSDAHALARATIDLSPGEEAVLDLTLPLGED